MPLLYNLTKQPQGVMVKGQHLVAGASTAERVASIEVTDREAAEILARQPAGWTNDHAAAVRALGGRAGDVLPATLLARLDALPADDLIGVVRLLAGPGGPERALLAGWPAPALALLARLLASGLLWPQLANLAGDPAGLAGFVQEAGGVAKAAEAAATVLARAPLKVMAPPKQPAFVVAEASHAAPEPPPAPKNQPPKK
jgi:hypothetical protein